MIDFSSPPDGFSTGGLYSSPLRIYWQGGLFWIYDGKGFLCRTDSTDIVHTLLVCQALRPDKTKPYGAREFLFPEELSKRLARQATVEAAHTAVFGEPRPFPKKGQQRPITGLTLKDLGI